MFEVEQKFHVDDFDALAAQVEQVGAQMIEIQRHADTYYRHPCRDFAQTREALRVRRIDGQPLITYKGQPVAGKVKARQELEWSLAPGDPDGSRTEQLLECLGFAKVATVRKCRRGFQMSDPWSDLTVVLDQVEDVGNFAEIELVIEDSSQIDAARRRINELAEHLGLCRDEPRSYLNLLLGVRNT